MSYITQEKKALPGTLVNPYLLSGLHARVRKLQFMVHTFKLYNPLPVKIESFFAFTQLCIKVKERRIN